MTDRSGAPRARIARISWAAATLFCILAANYVLRPVRDALGVSGRVAELPWLYTGTLVSVLVAQSAVSTLAARLRRDRLVIVTLGFFALGFLLFFAVLRTTPLEKGSLAARGFFVFMSVFNLLAVSLTWSLSVDVFDRGAASRWFGLVSAGGTVGAMVGAGLASLLAPRTGPVPLVLLGAAFVAAAIACTMGLSRAASSIAPGDRPVVEEGQADRHGGAATSALAGLRQLRRSRYLRFVCAWLLLFAISSTFAYVEQARAMKSAALDVTARTTLFARMDLATNLLALAGQSLLAAAALRGLGVRGTLAVLPAFTLLGFALLVAAPRLGLPPLTLLVAFQVLRRGLDFAITRPAREVLFTVVPRADKYQAKSFIDTFVYRGGDLLGAWSSTLLAERAGAPAALVVGGLLCLLWLGVSRAIPLEGDGEGEGEATAR